MRNLLAFAAVLGAVATSAAAEPSLEIRHTAARVVIIPEARNDVQVTILDPNPHMPLTIGRYGDLVIVDGPLGRHPASCNSVLGVRSVYAWGIGRIDYDRLPRIIVRAPMDVKVAADGAVWGEVGRGRSLDLANAGCGDWALADQQGAVKVHTSGSGDVRAGSVGSAEVSATGSSDVAFTGVRGGLTVGISGSGDVTAAWVNGPLHAHVGGSGDVTVHNGKFSDMDVAIAGSGDVTFGGVAQSLKASIAGSGDVHAAHVTGPVSKAIAGSGDVTYGHGT
jgi:Putative auto-transporter adhesin, head GIN domain